jgi:hypothetical protein
VEPEVVLAPEELEVGAVDAEMPDVDELEPLVDAVEPALVLKSSDPVEALPVCDEEPLVLWPVVGVLVVAWVAGDDITKAMKPVAAAPTAATPAVRRRTRRRTTSRRATASGRQPQLGVGVVFGMDPMCPDHVRGR